jgi:RNA polymerase sigma-70 factor (ECF subfamily)
VERAQSEGVPPRHLAGDLLLACGCARGDQAATGQFLNAFHSLLFRVAVEGGACAAAAADVRQAVYEALLLPRGAQPARLRAYCGTGPLSSWVVTSAVRQMSALRRAERRRRVREVQSSLDRSQTMVDPELEFLKRRYGPELEGALVTALEQLCERDKTLLRLNVSEGLTLGALALRLGVSRATAARWLEAARDLLRQSLDLHLRSRLQMTATECRPLLPLLRGELALSLRAQIDRC